MTLPRILKIAVLLFITAPGLSQTNPYYGTPLGAFLTLSNGLKGDVFVVDDHDTIFIKGFSYDGLSEDAVFWGGSSENPDVSGFVIPGEASAFLPLPPYVNRDIILRLPEGKNIKSLRWLCVWNRNSSKSLGTLIFSLPIQPPHPMAIGPLVNTKKGVSTGDILILNTQTLLVPDFNYDGSGKETYWWLSKGTKPNEVGINLLENRSDAPLQEKKNSTVVITLPKGHFVGDYDTLSVWSKSEAEDYGFVDVPKLLNIPPSPSTLKKQELKMEEFNCEMLNDNLGLEVRWLIEGDDVVIHLIGNIGLSEYMTLGLSKDDTETRFDSADAAVAGIDANGKGYAIDYFLESNEKCKNGRGMCPDAIHGSVDNLELLQAERRGNSTTVVFKRRLRAEDKVYDQNIYTDGPQAILWAVGRLLPDGFADTPALQSRGNLLLDFGREPNWNCPPQKKSDPSSVYVKERNHYIHCPSDHSFRAQLGPSPRSNIKKVWYINGLPTPELTVQRGNTYTFIIEGGLISPFHHPFYITNSKEGGMYKNILEVNDALEMTFAGIQQDHLTGTLFPTAEGRLCDWSYEDKNPEFTVETQNLDIKPTLTLKCEPGKAGTLIWTPSAATPDVVYYQSFMERNLGGKIRVVDFCEETNPNLYLEATTKGGKPKANHPRPYMDGLERESESKDFSLISTIENREVLDVKEIREKHEGKENLDQNVPKELIHETFPPKIDKYTLSKNVINSFRISPDNLNENINVADKYLLENTTSSAPQTSEHPEEVFPHDESERSDTYLPHHTDFRKTVNDNKAALNSHKDIGHLSVKHPTHSSSEISSISALGKLPPQDFKPHFEGGFIPLVMNPMKEKEFVQTKEFIYPPQFQNRLHRPFLYNESVPFHGTFKPGVPDFSGFNISNYSQEDGSVIITHNQDNLSILSASKPQPIHKHFPPMGAIPLHVLQRHNESPRRPQRPQDYGSRFRQQNQPFGGTRKNIFPPLPIINKPNFPIPNLREEDLTGVSSQRVYVSLQATGDKKSNPTNILHMGFPSTHNRKPQNPQPNKMIYPPPIQRRPDFYEEKEVAVPHSNAPQRNFNTQRIPTNINKQNQQKLNIPALQSGGSQGQANARPQLPGNMEHFMITPGHLRHPYPIIQVPGRERVQQVSVLQKGIPLRPNHSRGEKLKLNDGILNSPQNAGNRLPFHIHMVNPKENIPQESHKSVESQESDSSSSKEHRPLPLLVNAELVELPNKHVPQNFVRERPAVNPSLLISLNGSLNSFATNSNIRNPHTSTIHIQSNQKNSPFKTVSITKPSTASGIENTPFSQISNRPIMSEVYDTLIQDSGNDRNKTANIKELSDPKLEESLTLDSLPASPDHDEFEKSILEALTSEKFSSSKSTNMELPIFSDYHPEVDESDRSDPVGSLDYDNFDVPFGARLKFPQNGSKVSISPFSQIPKILSSVVGKPQTHSKHNRNRNSNNEIKPAESPQTTIPFSSSSTPTTTYIITSSATTTTEATLLSTERVSNIAIDNKENISFENEDDQKNLYYTSPFPSLPIFPHRINSSTKFNKDTESSDEVKHIPIIADTLEDIVQTKYIGRKNILPNNSNFSFPAMLLPPKVSDNINLPQISENPPIHDNRTDYSILNHVLTLIGGSPEQREHQVSS